MSSENLAVRICSIDVVIEEISYKSSILEKEWMDYERSNLMFCTEWW